MIDRLWPSTLQRYVLREFWKIFSLSLLACTLFILLMTLFRQAGEWEEYGISVTQVAALSPYLMPHPLAYAVPLAVLLAATMVFGRLSAENELLAAQAGGAPIRVLALPIVLSAALLCCGTLWCTQAGLRWGYSSIKNDVLKISKPEAFLKNLQKEGTSFTLPLEGGEIVRINMLPHVRDEEAGKVRRPIHISYFSGQDVGKTILAEDYEVDSSLVGKADRTLTLRLIDMQVLGSQPMFARDIVKPFPLPPLDKVIKIDDSRGKRGWMQNWNEASRTRESLKRRRQFLLQRAADLGAMAAASSPLDCAAPVLSAAAWADTRIASEAMYGTGGALDRIRSDEAECFRKLSLSLVPISMAFLGIGLGLLVRKSQLLIGFLLSLVVYALGYYPIMIVCKELSNAGSAGLWIAWLPNVILLAAGYALWRAYERGWLGALPPWLASLGPKISTGAHTAAVSVWRPFAALRDMMIGFLRYKTDGYVSGAFLVPLLVVLITVAALFTALDLVEHGGEVLDSIMRAGEKRAGVEARATTTAVLDVMTYYAIRALEVVCDLLPLLILLAGVLCVFTLVRSNEHLILKSSGVRLQRAFRPIIILTLIVSAGVTVLRETIMPELIMQRNFLKPLVYHRNPAPTALALHTTDLNGSPVLFQMSQYSSGQRAGRDLRVYLLGERREGRIPAIVADQAVWTGDAWQLKTDLSRAARSPLAALSSGNENKPPAEATDASGKKAAPDANIVNYGFLIRTDASGEEQAAFTVPDKQPPKKPRMTMPEWRGGVTPSLIESDRLGPAVMSLRELRAASEVKREYAVEFYRRAFEVFMAVFLLWTSLPLLLKEETRHQFLGIGLSIVVAAAYWGLNVGCAEAARENILPLWGILIPHAIFMGLGVWNFYFSMET
ncbi:MAG TPA: LptF/LptG family permease [Planctomycetota bacterium]|nr:LptF/LptG family permease [Planctomycetota bacterium]